MHTAAATNLAELVLKFLKHPDIDVNLSSKKGSTPAMEAARNGNLESLKVKLFSIHLYKILVSRFFWKMTVLT